MASTKNHAATALAPSKATAGLYQTKKDRLKGFLRTIRNHVSFLVRTGGRRLKKDPFALLGLVAILVLTILTVEGGLSADLRLEWPFYVILGVSVVIGSLLWIIPRKTYYTMFARTFGWLPVVLGAASWPYWYWYGTYPTPPQNAFFETAAQVLPVLLLAAVIDVRRTKTLSSSQLVLPIIAFFLGEIAALDVLAFSNGHGGASDFASVAASLTSTVIALILAVLADVAAPSSNRIATARSRKRGMRTSSRSPTRARSTGRRVSANSRVTK
jgi:hypothetical protein